MFKSLLFSVKGVIFIIRDVTRVCALEITTLCFLSTFVIYFAVIHAWNRLLGGDQDAAFGRMRGKVEVYRQIARRLGMVAMNELPTDLDNDALVRQVRRLEMGFSSELSAAYHMLKHPDGTDPGYSAYKSKLQDCIRNVADGSVTVTIGQEGTTRSIVFDNSLGRVIVLESNGRVFVATYFPFSS
jgi:hypothetical protein